MERLRHHLRPLAVALTTLALSAGIVLAAKPPMPAAAQGGLDRAGEAAGKTVPVVAAPEALPVPAETDEDVEQPAQEPEEPAEEPAEDADAPCELLPEGQEYANHGAKVCAAAQAPLPEGYANRGEYVSEVARANHGAEVRAQKAAGAGPEAKEKAKEKLRGAGAANGHAKGGRP